MLLYSYKQNRALSNSQYSTPNIQHLHLYKGFVTFTLLFVKY